MSELKPCLSPRSRLRFAMEYKKQIFTHQEKMIFLEILKKYMKIVEDKQTHTAALKLKNRARHNIAMEFNSRHSANYTVLRPRFEDEMATLHIKIISCLQFAEGRTAKQLRRLWMNWKHRQRYMIRRQQGQAVAISGPKVLQIAHALMSSVDSVDSDTMIEDVRNDLLEAGTSITESEESFNTTGQGTPPQTAIKIEPIASPIPPYETEAECETINENPIISPSNNDENPLEESSTKLEDRPAVPLGEEVQYLEVQLLKEKLRAQRKENKSKEIHTEVIQSLELNILREKFREAKAKADLAELCLKRAQL